MEVAITKMAANGQLVIPMGIRRKARIRASEKFIVYFTGSEIRLKPIEGERFVEELELLSRMRLAEDEVRQGKVTIADSRLSAKKIADLLMK